MANGYKIPKMNKANNGPTIDPTKAMDACNTVPAFPTPKDITIANKPYEKAIQFGPSLNFEYHGQQILPINFVIVNAFFSSLSLIRSLIKSSQVTAANALNPEESVLAMITIQIFNTLVN